MEEDSSDESSAEEDSERCEQYNPYLHSDSEDSDERNELSLPSSTHTVTFKCIGSTYDPAGQEILSKASKILRDHGTVETTMAPEPNNPYYLALQHRWLVDRRVM